MTEPYPAAIGLAVASAVVMLLVIPPFDWHIRNQNVGVSSVITWSILLNLFNLINAIVWPNDDFVDSFKGQGLCDVEVKLQVASQVALPASFARILRALAAVLNTDKLGSTRLDKRKTLLVDLIWCVGCPLLQMFLHYVVQPNRYFIFGISGCVPSITSDWLSFAIILLPPVIWTLVCAYYAVIIVIRLYRYRRSFRQTLINNDTNKSRFLRLYILCLLWLLTSVPIQCFVFYVSFANKKYDYTWNDTHDSEDWKVIPMIPTHGSVVYDRYIWLSAGIITFILFGIGKEAMHMYQTAFRAIGCIACMAAMRRKREASDTQSQHVDSSVGSGYMLKKGGVGSGVLSSCGSDAAEQKECELV